MGDKSEIRELLAALGLLTSGDSIGIEPLTGGVASDIWRVDVGDRSVCVKRALAKLKVADDWQAPVERNVFEVAWFRVAAGIVPRAVPEILGHDPDGGAFVMEYLSPHDFPVWKAQLRDGIADSEIAREVARRIVQIHNATADNETIARQFATDELFHALRVEPYLLATAKRHDDVAGRLRDPADNVMANKKALVHGDVSPKNILVGERGPVFLDAECAWYGEPAFDTAFCLNHLLLKCLWNRPARSGFLRCFEALASTYLHDVAWEPRHEIDRRTATLLPALMLARVDGKSPVEYVTNDSDKNLIRQFAKRFLLEPAEQVTTIAQAWASELEKERRRS